MLDGCEAPCQVELRSWGFSDNEWIGYIRVNGQLIINSTQPGPPRGPDNQTRGVNIAVLNTSTCRVSNLRNFDVFGSPVGAYALIDYIRSGLPSNGSVLLGVTFDDPYRSSSMRSIASAFSTIGVTISNYEVEFKFAFIAFIGSPALTICESAGIGGNNVLVSRSFPDITLPGALSLYQHSLISAETQL